MKTLMQSLTGLLLMAFCLSAAQAAVTGKASTTVLKAKTTTTLTLTYLNTDATTPAVSGQLSTANVSPSVNYAGPLTVPAANSLSETITISAAQVNAWQSKGYQQVVLRRNFVIGRNSQSVVFRLSIQGSGLENIRTLSEFAIQRLQLRFENQTPLTLVQLNNAPSLWLDVHYSGTGVLEGRWQIAEPGSTQGRPVYRTLKLEKRNLANNQYTRLTSPRLPANRVGKYLVRFCLTNRDDTLSRQACTDANGIVEAAYQVIAASPTVSVINTSPTSALLTETTELSWTEVPNTAVYQLQIFQPIEGNMAFVGGMLLPSSTYTSTLAPSLMQKLTKGQSYHWQINALGTQGEQIGKSPAKPFVFK